VSKEQCSLSTLAPEPYSVRQRTNRRCMPYSFVSLQTSRFGSVRRTADEAAPEIYALEVILFRIHIPAPEIIDHR
jgi:hypothetical protein